MSSQPPPIQQFDIYWVNLDPGAQGVETRKNRPCLILSNDTFNRGRMLVIAPLLKQPYKAPWIVQVKATPENSLDQDRVVDMRQMRAVDKLVRLGKFKGRLETMYHQELLEKATMLF